MLFAVHAEAEAIRDSNTNILISNFQDTVKSKILTEYVDFFFIILIQIELYSHSIQNIARLLYENFCTNPQGINCLTLTGFFNAFLICTVCGILLDLRERDIKANFQNMPFI